VNRLFLHILEIKFPVVRHHLRIAARVLSACGSSPAGKTPGHVGAQKGFQVGRDVAEGAEHQTSEHRDTQSLQLMLFLAELPAACRPDVARHARSHAGELAGQVVDPTVINAAEFADVALALQTQQVPRWTQRLTKALMAPSASRTTMTAVSPTVVATKSPGFVSSTVRHR